MQIIYEDNQKIVIFKPAGKLTQSNRSFDVDLVSEVMTYRRKKNEDAYAAVINRLDRPVSGLVLMAKNKQEAGRLSKIIQNYTLQKQYEAIVCGKPESESDTFVDYLAKDAKENKSFVVAEQDLHDHTEAKRAELNYQVIDTFYDEDGNVYSHVQIHLITGRHHQIRAQFSSRNLPLLGDVKYGGKDASGITLKGENQKTLLKPFYRNEIALCSVSLTIDKLELKCKPGWIEE